MGDGMDPLGSSARLNPTTACRAVLGAFHFTATGAVGPTDSDHGMNKDLLSLIIGSIQKRSSIQEKILQKSECTVQRNEVHLK